MRRSDGREAREIASYWKQYIRDDSDAAVPVTVEGAAQFAIAHAILEQAKAIGDVASAIDGLASAVRGNRIASTPAPPPDPKE